MKERDALDGEYMSRIRSVHPGLWTDERFVSVSPMARLLFMGLWTECDDQGSFEWSPLKLKMRLMPADNADAAALLAELADAGCVMRYELEGRQLGAVRNFCRYQRPKKPNSTYSQTDAVRKWVDTEARSTRDSGEGVGNLFGTDVENDRRMDDEGGRMEDEGGKGDKTRKRATALPEGFEPVLTEAAQALADKLGPEGYARELSQFVDHHRAKGSTMKDWQAAFRTWLSNAVKWKENGNGNGGGGGNGKQSGWLQRGS